jgi:hypothetical protein
MKCKPVHITGVLAVVFALCFASSATARADERPIREGFVLRLSAGVGVAQTEIDDGDSHIKFGTVGADFNVAAGGVVADDLIVHATWAGWLIPDPTMEISHGPATFESEHSGSVRVALLGAGVTAYFWDDFYVSPSLGLATFSSNSRSGADEGSDIGAGLDFTLGKEWRVDSRWSIGAAAAVGLHYIPDNRFNSSYRGGNLGARFSATFD